MWIGKGKQFAIGILACFLLALGAPVGYAQATLKLGSLDLDKIQEKWEKWKSAEESIKNLIASKRKELLEKRKELLDSYESFKLQKELIPAETAKERYDKLQLEGNKLQEKEVADAKDVDDKKKEILDPLMEELKKAVEGIAKEGNYSFVFARRLLFFVDPAYDITDKVLERINKK